MNKILIHQFGPICEAEIDLDKKNAGIYRHSGIWEKYSL